MPQSWDMGQILSLPLRRKACGRFFRSPKNPTTSAGFEPEASMLTTRPPKPQVTRKLKCMQEWNREWIYVNIIGLHKLSA